MTGRGSSGRRRTALDRRTTLAGLAAVGGLGLTNGVAGRGPPDGSPGGPPSDDGTRSVTFVANSGDGTVTLIDAENFELLREIDILPDGERADPTEDPVQGAAGQRIVEAAAGENYAQDLDVSPDGRTLYASRGHRGDVAAFDLETGELTWKTPVRGVRADHMTISPDGGRLYVSSIGNEDVVEVLDAATGENVGSFETGEFPHDNRMSPDGEFVYNSSIGDITQPREIRENRPDDASPVTNEPYQLTVADAETLEVVDAHVFDRGIRPWEMTADGRFVYAQLSFFHGFVEYDLEERRIRRTVHLPKSEEAEEMDEDEYPFEAPHHGLAMSPDESLICVAGRVSNYAAVVRRDDLSEVALIDVGESPGWAANTPDGSHCAVTSEEAGTVSFVSYEERTEVARVEAGDTPKYSTSAAVPEEVI